jgi:hypothetical protein
MQALSLAQQRPEIHLKQVLHCTRGIVFLGTPHHGSGLAHWAEGLAKAIGVLKQTNSEILAVLKSDSEVLARVQDGFHTMIRSRAQDGQLQPIEITCFFEELPLPGVGVVSPVSSTFTCIAELMFSQVVPSHSAILPGYIPIGIRTNHMDMTKFENADDPGFKAVVGELRRWVREIVRTESERLLSAERSQGQETNEGRSSEQQVRRITQGGSHFGPTTVSGGSLFQGNYIG